MYHMHARTWWELTLQSMVQERGSEGGQVEDPSKVHPVNKAGIQRAKARNAGALTGHQTGCPAPACIDWTSVPLISLTSYIENMASKGKKGSVSQEAGQQQKKMIEIKNMIQEAFRRIDPDYQIDEQLLKDTGVRSRRGEHVINNDVLKFHTKILTERGIQRDVQCPLKRSIQNDIIIALLMLLEPTSQMKSNPLPAVQNWRIQMLRRTEEVNWRDEADCIITNMNACQAYVDPFAKVKWTGNSHANLTKCSGHVPRHTWTWLLWEIVSFCLDG
ncbi:uncharacterized protein LOC114786902 isoform X2 [Denticeps clupeoides]|uniref:uncharacterized protein LOC114786902 isoform X2 n=1 Tax=Denticeps clupeoides TaxID=299321 RepID=UPI0010A32AB6|nr:uncharacterized protein LOC114786902 isoform X2 [Denticeps clupeoides]